MNTPRYAIAVVGAAVALAGVPAAQAAGPEGDAGVRRACAEYVGDSERPATLCGARSGLVGPRLTLASRTGAVTRGVASAAGASGRRAAIRWAAVESRERLLPGETVRATWTALRAPATLRVVLADRYRMEPRAITLTARPGDRQALVAVAEDGTATATVGGRTTVVPVPPLRPGDPRGPELAWTARTPRAAVRAALAHASADEGTRGAAQCAAMETGLRAELERALAAFPGRDPFPVDCAVLAGLSFGFLDVRDLGTTGRILAARRLSDDEAVVRVRLRHRYTDGFDRPAPRRPVRVDARVLVVREADGRWRIATPWSLSGRSALPGSGVPLLATDAQLRALRRAEWSETRRLVRSLAADAARRARLSAPVATGATDCGPGPRAHRTDPAGDGKVGDLRTRDPALFAADVREVTQGRLGDRLCFTLRFERPPPERFTVDIVLGDVTTGRGHTVEVVDGVATLDDRPVLEGERDTAVPGIAVTRDGALVRIVLPAAAADPAAGAPWALSVASFDRFDDELRDEVPGTAAAAG